MICDAEEIDRLIALRRESLRRIAEKKGRPAPASVGGSPHQCEDWISSKDGWVSSNRPTNANSVAEKGSPLITATVDCAAGLEVCGVAKAKGKWIRATGRWQFFYEKQASQDDIHHVTIPYHSVLCCLRNSLFCSGR
jgi:hypothetical protein